MNVARKMPHRRHNDVCETRQPELRSYLRGGRCGMFKRAAVAWGFRRD
jgi:hypothetical protein